MAKKIKDLNREATKQLVPEMVQTLQKSLNKYGLTVERFGSARFGGHNLTVKFEVKVPEMALNKAEDDYNQYMDMYDIKAPYGFEFTARGKTYTVTGINHKAPKNRILLSVDDGGKAHCPVRMVNWEFTKGQQVTA